MIELNSKEVQPLYAVLVKKTTPTKNGEHNVPD